MAIAVLIGAAVNAAFDTVFPQKSTTRARLELVQRLRRAGARRRGDRATRFAAVPDHSATDAGARGKVALPDRPGRRGGSWVGGCCWRWRSWSAPSCWSTSTATATATATTRPAYGVDLVDSIYYTTVTLSTTGYGDIAPVSEQARLVNAFVITPLRIAFLVLLIGTTLEVLASQGREMFRVARWRKSMGRARRRRRLRHQGPQRRRDPRQQRAGPRGDRRRRPERRRPRRTRTPTGSPWSPATRPGARCCAAPASPTADQVIITTDRDDSNVLATLTVRQLNPDAWIVAAVREQENVAADAPVGRQLGDHLLRRGRPAARPVVAVARPSAR